MESVYTFDAARFHLGSLCKRGHNWIGSGKTLRRIVGGNCLECESLRQATDAKRKYHRDYMRKKRPAIGQAFSEKGLTTRGTERIRSTESVKLQQAIRKAGFPSVARLVMDEQLRHWREHPEDRAAHKRQWDRACWWLRYAVNPDLRLYHREKSKRRKAHARGQTPTQISVSALRLRFDQFGNCCAYCGGAGDMEIEHIKPISKGGLHDIGNIVPACSRCNTSKKDKEMESWYRAQPFFSELRLYRIR